MRYICFATLCVFSMISQHRFLLPLYSQGDLTLILKGVLVRRVEPTSDASKVLKEVNRIDLRIFISTINFFFDL